MVREVSLQNYLYVKERPPMSKRLDVCDLGPHLIKESWVLRVVYKMEKKKKKLFSSRR